MSIPAPRMLIVDDEADTCANLADIFVDFGYQVDVAHDGETALPLIEKTSYDVALLDLRMPGMSGMDLYRHIKRVSAGTVAIVVTAHATRDTIQSALDAGAWSIVSKPVDIPSLVGLVSEAVNSPLILIVDDDMALCQSLREVLRGRGYRVHLAHDAHEAEKALRSQEFQLVVVDAKLPGENDVSVLQVIQQSHRQAPTLVITDEIEPTELGNQPALPAGAQAVCYKPFDVSSLLSTIGKLVKAQHA